MVEININISIDPKNTKEVELILELIHSLSSLKDKEVSLNKPSLSTKSSLENGSDEVFTNENQRLKDENQKYQQEIEEKQKLISEYKNEIEILKQSKKDVTTQLEAYKKELEDKTKECSNIKEKYCTDYYPDDPAEKIFFKVSEDGHLEENKFGKHSLYYAIRKDNKFIYTINQDGPIINAMSDIERCLMPYCEIKSNTEGANTILVDSFGEAEQLTPFTPTKKATISLIKQ